MVYKVLKADFDLKNEENSRRLKNLKLVELLKEVVQKERENLQKN